MSDQCASCGKADANLKACKACKLVKYCGVECQVAHRAAHKKACKKKARELFDVQLYAQPPGQEECPICIIPLTYNAEECTYMACCGKHICNGCVYCLPRQRCPFCNTAGPKSEEEIIKRLFNRIEKYNDTYAMVMLSEHYSKGQYGLLVDQSKAFELLQRACELGTASVQVSSDLPHYHLGIKYQTGDLTEIDKKKAVHHYQIAAMMGNIHARHNLGCSERENRNYHRAMKHFMIAAECGCENSLDVVKQGFRDGIVTKEQFEKTLRDYQASCDETKSEQRDRAAVIKARARK